MKYLEILQFNPIVDVIQFNRLSERDYQLDALHNFVYPDYFLEKYGFRRARPKGYSSNR